MFDLMADMSLAADRSLNWNTLTVLDGLQALVDQTLQAHERLWARGAKVVPLTFPGFKTFYFNMATGFATTYGSLPGWAPLIALPIEQRMAIFADPDERRRLEAGAQSKEAGLLRAILSAWATQTVVSTFAPENRAYEGRTIGEIAAELGQDPFDVMLDIALRDQLRTVFKSVERGSDDPSWDLQRRVWRQGKAVLGASDAGAHVDFGASFNYPTTMLGACLHRDLIPLEEAVHLITDVPARFYGISGRGRIAVGSYADIVIFDAETVGSGPVSWTQDLPGGAGRLYAEAKGIERVLVNGVEIIRGTQFTGALAGKVLRSGRDTITPRSGSGLLPTSVN
jgi:N-acyl-D-aspartate/D-glutamate deacylase